MSEAKFHILFIICCGERPDSKYKYNHRTTVHKIPDFLMTFLFLWKIAGIIWEMFILKMNLKKIYTEAREKVISFIGQS